MKSHELHGQNEQHPMVQENASSSKNAQPLSALGQDSAYQPFEALGDNLYYQHLKITEPFNRLDQALNEYSKALELRPECPILLAKLSRVYLRQGNYKKAESKALQALEHQAKGSEAIAIGGYTLGYIRYKENNFKGSQHALENALYHGGWHSSRTLFCLFYTYWAIAKHSRNFLVKGWMGTLGSICFALACMVSVIDPEPLQLFQLAGLVPHLIKAYCCENSQQRDKALQDYLALHQKYLGLAPLMNLIASVYERNGQSEEALDWLQKAIHRDPLNEEGYFQMASLIENHGDHPLESQIPVLYQKLLKLRPGDAQLHCSLANGYSTLQEYDKAAIHYKAAFNLSNDKPWQALIAQTLASLYQDIQKNTEAAVNAYQLAVQLNPKEVNNYIHLGILYFEKTDFDNAKIMYEKALRMSPDNPRIHSNLGYLKWLQGEIPQAVKHYEKAIELDPFYDIPHNNLGVIHLDVLGNVLLAIELIQKATQLNEHYALAYYNLGRAYMFTNQKLEAAQAFQKAQTLNEYTKELDTDEIKARLNQLFNTFEP